MATTKKIKKVETPIDERETFVSLQKNFADSELSVEEKLKTLYELQSADNEIEKIVQLRGELPVEVADIENEIAAQQAKIQQIKDLIAEYEHNVENRKQDIVDIDAEIAKYQKQLENIANSREFDSINKELENQNLLRQIAEKQIRETLEEVEAKNRIIVEIEEKIKARNEDLEAKKSELSTIVESTSAEEEKLQAKRNECATKIDERTMSAYNRIRRSVRNHLAVVSVFDGNSCGGCFNRITPQRLVEIASNKKLIICEHCGRIIVNPNFEV